MTLLILLAVAIAGVAIAGCVLFVSHRLRGYWIEAVALGALRDDDEDFAVVYHEGSRKLMLLGRRRPGSEPDILFVPSEDSWNHRVEPWAWGRRDQILDRLRHDPVTGHCEILPASLPG